MFFESSLNDLYQSAVKAFPETTCRQHLMHTIDILDLNIVPFVGVKTLFCKGKAQNEDKNYGPVILIKDVEYYRRAGVNVVEITGADGRRYRLKKIAFREADVLVRCNCEDFKWRFTHTDFIDRSLYGRNRKKYEAKYNPGSANPLELPGMCKHLMALAVRLNEYKIFN